MNTLNMMWDTVDGQLVCRWMEPSARQDLELKTVVRSEETRGTSPLSMESSIARAA